MPIYEYWCQYCDKTKEEVRLISMRDRPGTCDCSGETIRIWSSPVVYVWNADRQFPNLSETSDGMSFDSKQEYELYLKEQEVHEVSQGGIVTKPHGNRTVFTEQKPGADPKRPGAIRPTRRKKVSNG